MRYIIMLVIGLTCCALPVQAAVYKCREPNGTTRFTDTPCNARDHSVRRLESQKTTGNAQARAEKTSKLLRAYADERRIEREQMKMAAAQEAKEQQLCNRARAQQQSLELAGSVYRVNAQGQREILSDADHAAALASARSEVARFCVDP